MKEETAVLDLCCVVMVLDDDVKYVQLWQLVVSDKGQGYSGKKETMLRRRGKGALICSWVVTFLTSFLLKFSLFSFIPPILFSSLFSSSFFVSPYRPCSARRNQ